MCAMTGTCDELRKVISEAETMGWTVGRTRNNHLKFQMPGKRSVFTSGTPGDWRATKNALGKLRRAMKESRPNG